jgi:TolB-like protein
MSLFAELKRRNVVRVGLAYIVIGWFIAQVAEFAFENFGAPDWVLKTFVVVLLLGLPLALFFAWAFEITPEGVKREKDVDRSQSIAHSTGRKLDFVIIGTLVLALGYFVWNDRQSGSTEVNAELDRSIAVLPFVNMSSDKEQEWFADGLTEEILNSLARTPDLLVASRTSSFQYKGQNLDISAIARSLGVAHILEGSVRRGGDRLRVTAQLIRANDGFHLWSETFDRKPEDVIAIQEDVAFEIANALETAMNPEALKKMVSAGTRSVAAYEAYLEALAHLARATQSGDELLNLQARTALERAQELDPEFAAAHFEMALFWQGQMSVTSFGSELTSDTAEERKEKYKVAIAKAIRFEEDPDRRARYRADEAFVELRYLESLRILTEYLAKRPNDRDAVESQMYTLMNLGRWQEAQAAAHHLASISGTSASEIQNAIVNLVFSGDTAGAADVSRQALQTHPDSALVAYQAHRAFLWDGATDEAREVLRVINSSQIPWFNKKLATMRQACADGDREQALAIHEEFVDEYQEGESILWISYHTLGQREAASAVLRPYDEANQMYSLASYLIYPYFDPSPLPRLMEVLKSQGIVRPAPIDIPFSCDADFDKT